MPVSEGDYREPYWVKMRDRYPMSYDKKDRFNTINPRHSMARYNGDPDTGWKQAGYNPNQQSTRVEKINLTSDTITLRPY